MLRLPAFELLRPRTTSEAVALLAKHGEAAMIVAGGTDLVPNMKHELFEPDTLVSLEEVEELRGVRVREDGGLAIGAMTRLAEVAASPEVASRAPALAQAASLVAGPQLRTMGTLGGNVMLDTRCQWYNQTHFWRQALGFCLKKDGTECHVVAGGRKCVAAASNDTAPALMTLGATLVLASAESHRELPVDELWRADGIRNKALLPGELLTEVRVPPQASGHRGAYGKLRDRGSIDFPLLGLAVRLDLDAAGVVEDADLVAVALQARPVRVKRVAELLRGTRPGTPAFDEAVDAVAQLAHKKCHPLANVPGDERYRRRMVPVYTRRTLHAAADGAGPVHHV
jgi:4-hydroxybenzoyl-CoA reductase subunit beta